MAIQHELPQKARTAVPANAAKIGLTVSTQEIATPEPPRSETQDLLIISPYTEREHLLDLKTLDMENAIVAQALVHLKCLRSDYATAPYIDTFNWGEVMEQVKRLAQQKEHSWKGSSFFVVAFRSPNPPDDSLRGPGYWFGSPDKDGKNLATCVWRSQEDARKGGIGPAHRRAAAAARDLYSHWKIDRHRLIIHDNVENWEITDWA
ncbi:hypothetical protein NPX13_g3215 [Xylaria arbuscula]|uniref:Uncharacterized protein n=1 Tax=Xylaria arbuscula TaxID=114810 RepID=A0A9W8NHQ6_9PEZI|nr:hypothetical protein NPX13_g3215 [Xylaria arbuscula]